MPDLITLTETKDALGLAATDTSWDVRLTSGIKAASQAILNQTDRDFASTQQTSERQFKYDGSGYLEIDDASTVTQVKIESSVLVAADWVAKPFGQSVFHWIEVPPQVVRSPEMGFAENLDTWHLRHGPTRELNAYVTATWGWPTVPEDVKRATVMTVVAMMLTPAGGGAEGQLASESIEGYSRSWAIPPLQDGQAIPRKAEAILAAYRRVSMSRG